MAANTDEPAFPEADTAATTDEKQIREWWALWPDANIGIATDNLLAIRIDPRCTDEVFRDTLGTLFQQHGGRTGSLVLVGELVGSYVMFELPVGASVQGRPDFLCDRMSILSSVDDVLIGPGSTIDGVSPYSFHNNRSLSPAPSWLMDLCGVELLQRFTPITIHRSGNGADIAPDTVTGKRLANAANAIADAANGTLFRFSPEADAELHAVEAFKAKEIARPDASPTLRQWLDKMPNEFGRLSLVFHFIEHHGAAGGFGGTIPAMIGRDTAARARRYLTEFVYSHALTFYLKDLGASTMDEHALWIAGYVLARGLPAISSRDIYRAYPALKSPEKRSLEDSRLVRLADDCESEHRPCRSLATAVWTTCNRPFSNLARPAAQTERPPVASTQSGPDRVRSCYRQPTSGGNRAPRLNEANVSCLDNCCERQQPAFFGIKTQSIVRRAHHLPPFQFHPACGGELCDLLARLPDRRRQRSARAVRTAARRGTYSWNIRRLRLLYC
ncbi:bifunctional DNA primase/polymerase [Bradyrhizobium cytisi]|uniref:DUF3987 domain-containing protein n=1 Tax=Bradyrhizobium cytisi TaxID=515489 RepID=A0A5S4WCZ6_9BRAD|nr:bifunctional DNA primase/polymerase [Bradyrhizobium cytisi]TYL80176.1 DUF3987 domain-containing protein [Bradyrhizobium cytisi]